MGYEEQIRFKHSVEDALAELVLYASLLTDRELELAIAKLGDAAEKASTTSDKDLSFLKGVFLGLVRKLRATSQSKQNKAKRLWYFRKKSQMRQEIAKYRQQPALLLYEEEKAELEKKNQESQEHYLKEYRQWEQERSALGFFRRWFGGAPPRPVATAPKRPQSIVPSLGFYEERLRKLDFGELIVERILVHQIPGVEIAREFATEENVRSYEVRLIEN
ncbi:MAG: hypothetical protein CMP07_07295 [Xanthomonadales bacterium]|nr:hypothetical protein [Xanthomonadales bacterium]|tara:strand:+ start:4363 stop:5019 length:657 start_codon:yes stop_codon:yes gene_type:complete